MGKIGDLVVGCFYVLDRVTYDREGWFGIIVDKVELAVGKRWVVMWGNGQMEQTPPRYLIYFFDQVAE